MFNIHRTSLGNNCFPQYYALSDSIYWPNLFCIFHEFRRQNISTEELGSVSVHLYGENGAKCSCSNFDPFLCLHKPSWRCVQLCDLYQFKALLRESRLIALLFLWHNFCFLSMWLRISTCILKSCSLLRWISLVILWFCPRSITVVCIINRSNGTCK